MAWINHQYFTQRWLERAERENVPVDEGDKFISLWIAFNGWMKGKFGEDLTDRNLINKVKELKDFENVFNDLKIKDERFSENLYEFGKHSVVDMRYIDDLNKNKKYDGTFGSLIELIYQIRCNLFHGRKDIREDEKDIELIRLSHNVLLPLFKDYLRQHGH